MSHYIETAFMGSNKPAWHGLGTVVAGQPTSAEALRLAELDWTVVLEPVHVHSPCGASIELPGWRATVRTDRAVSDPTRALGCVGSRYTPIQNVDAFAMADDLVGEGGARFESAGSLKGGRRVWMLAKLPEPASVRDDKIEQYLLLTNSHDGSRAMEVLCTPVRVVCWNTLAFALRRGSSNGSNKVTIRHTSNAATRVAEARRVLGLAADHFQDHTETMEELAGYKVDRRFTEAYLKTLFPDPKSGGSNKRATKTRDRISDLFQGGQAGAEQDATRGTAYGLLNAVSEFVDHYRTVRVTGSSTREENRMESILYGSGAKVRTSAFGLLSRATGIGSDAPALVDLHTPDPTAENVLNMIDLN